MTGDTPESAWKPIFLGRLQFYINQQQQQHQQQKREFAKLSTLLSRLTTE